MNWISYTLSLYACNEMARQFLFRVELDGDRVNAGLIACDDDNEEEEEEEEESNDDDKRIEGV